MTGRRSGPIGPASAALLGGGIAFGLAAGAAVAAGRLLREGVSRDEANNPRLINWRWARTIAVRGARGGQHDDAPPVLDAGAKEAVQREYAARVARSAELVSEYTHIDLPAPLRRVHVFDRPDWVDANLAQFKLMFAPLDDSYADTIARAPGAAPAGMFGQVMLSAQMGILLGYLARRVLGQYDLSLLGREPVTEGRLYFVEPNIVAMERRYALPRDEFRAWIALHEVTHAFEFEAHPWVREYMNDLLTVYLRSLSEDLFSTRPGGALGLLAGRIKDNLFERGHMLEMMMSPAQRDVFRKLQALMALMEGYSNHVMNQVGARQLKDHAQLKATFESRAKSRGVAEQLFIKLTGLDIKLEQYVLGERFCELVTSERGLACLNEVWSGAEHLPTLDEINEPARWIARHARAAA
ncbi:MAG TPA: zinc-dependent metalloprotease [Chloroflexota bacterium]|nr:zinc-dependent metalloprotease [Chloroflexota bacterium]